MIYSEKSNHVIIDGCKSRQKTRRTARQIAYIISDTFWCKYPSLDTVWCNTDRNRLEMFRFKAIFAFVGSFFRFKVLGLVFDHNVDCFDAHLLK